MNDISGIRIMAEKLVDGRSALFNMLRDLDLSYRELKKLYENIIVAFVSAIDAKSPWTKGHSERVTNYAVAIAQEMCLTQNEIYNVKTAALLHDIGKIGTYEVILDKSGTLTGAEVVLIKMHTVKGEEILKPVSQLRDIIPIVRSHHERMDGRGYPDGLSDGEIPLLSRIITVADSFDSMMSDRPYRCQRRIEDALLELQRCSGTQFDPQIVEVFLRAIKKYVLL